jgi:hypothetical protein
MKRILGLLAVAFIFICFCRQLKNLHLTADVLMTGQILPVTPVRSEGKVSSFAVIQLNKGEPAGVFMGFDKQGNKGKSIFFFRSTDNGRTWNKPKPVLTDEQDWENPVLCRLSDGTVVLAFGRTSGTAPESGQAGFFISYSRDNGETFTVPRLILVPRSDWVKTSKDMLETKDGRILLPLAAGRKNKGDFILIAVSKDRGLSWTQFHPIAKDPSSGAGLENPTLAILADQRILCLMEGGREDPYVYQAISKDDGATWEKPHNAGIQGKGPVLAVTRHGTTLCLFQDSWPAGLSVVRSFDRGESWEGETQLPVSEQEDLFPHLTLLDDGILLATYRMNAGDGDSGIGGVLFHDGPPKRPSGLSGSFKSPGAVHMRWNSVEGAKYYVVFRDAHAKEAVKSDTAFNAVVFGTFAVPRFVDTRVDSGKTYVYRVAAVRTLGRPVEGTGSISETSAPFVVRWK